MKRTMLRYCSGWVGLLFSASLCADPIINRDPTAPALQVQSSTKNVTEKPNYILQSILVDGGRRIALINDMFVSEGDMVNNAKVIAIHKNSVDLMESGQKVTIYLFGEIQE
jgi:hypothetical protein